MEHPVQENALPIYVDMDGTLIKTDIAQELLLQCCKTWSSAKSLAALIFSGRSKIKRFLAENATFSAQRLPYNHEVLAYLQVEKNKGRQVILATASDRLIANQVADHLKFFDDVLASEPGNNLKGANKLEAIKTHSQGQGFEYIGDSSADYPIWKESDKAGFVNPPLKPEDLVKNKDQISLSVDNKNSTLQALLKAIRPHQWAKNLLVFLPLFFAHQYFNFDGIIAASLTFLVFSFCASGLYLTNDLLDIEADRKHRSKKKRPFAAGELSPVVGVGASILLILGSFLLCYLLLDIKTLLVLLSYFIITNLYSFVLKNYSTIDVITLTALFTIRIIAGGVAVGIALSPWLINFSLFFFLSLAYMKRYIELDKHEKSGKLSGRNYLVEERGVIMTTGIVNGGISVFTLTMYLNQSYVIDAYASPMLLWLICPIMLFWIYRAWMWTKRGLIDDDPVVFAIKDKISFITVGILGLLILSAKYINLEAMFL